MPLNHFVETHQDSWFDRLKESIKSVATGAFMFVIAFPILFFNEHHAVKTSQGLSEGAGSVVKASADQVSPANDGKLVHVTGQVKVEPPPTDVDFGVSAPAVKLRRVVEMYQWKEYQKSEKSKNAGGSSTTTTTYDYKQEWSSDVIKSKDFRIPSGHVNPEKMPFESETIKAESVTVGAFQLSPELADKMDKFEALPANETVLSQMPAALRQYARVSNGAVYYGKNPNSPQIGDMRISFEIIKPAVVSIVAKQSQGKLAVFQTSSGSDIALLQVGTVTPEAMFQSAMSSSAAATWGLRLFGWLLMFGGIMLVVKPLVTIADVIPFLGSILEFGLSIFAGVISATLSMFTIALGWLFFRPMIGIALLFVTGLLAGGAVFMMLRNRSARPTYPQQPQSVQY